MEKYLTLFLKAIIKYNEKVEEVSKISLKMLFKNKLSMSQKCN